MFSTRSLLVAAVVAAVLACVAAANDRHPTGSAMHPTTSPRIALSNLDSQIDALRRRAQGCGAPLAPALDLAERLAFRARITSRWRDLSEAVAVVERAARCRPEDPRIDATRASLLADLHRFDEAARALDGARAKGARQEDLRGVEASVLHGRGDYSRALTLRRRDVEVYPNIRTLCALAILLGDMGRYDEAQATFDRARAGYRDVSPIPLAWLEYSRGRMLVSADRLQDAAAAFERGRELLPTFAANLGQLAEVHFELGNSAFAIGLLRRLALESEDPDYPAHLARMLMADGRSDEAERYRRQAAGGFAELMRRHPQMFADHAAEFWMAAGGEPRRALRAAAINLAARRTPRAIELFETALARTTDAPAECRRSRTTRSVLAGCAAELADPASAALETTTVSVKENVGLVR